AQDFRDWIERPRDDLSAANRERLGGDGRHAGVHDFHEHVAFLGPAGSRVVLCEGNCRRQEAETKGNTGFKHRSSPNYPMEPVFHAEGFENLGTIITVAAVYDRPLS